MRKFLLAYTMLAALGATTAALLMSTSLTSAQRGFLGGMTDDGYRPMDFSNDVYMGPGSKRHTRITKVKHRRHVSSDKQDADPLISGGEPDWDKNMDAKQRREAGFDDVRVAQKHNRNPNTPIGPSAQTSPKTPTSPSALTHGGVPGYTFNLTTMRYNGGFAHLIRTLWRVLHVAGMQRGACHKDRRTRPSSFPASRPRCAYNDTSQSFGPRDHKPSTRV
jgi:hypothetical protein